MAPFTYTETCDLVVVLVPVKNAQTKLGELLVVKGTVLVILNLPNLYPGGGGIAVARPSEAIEARKRICLLVWLMFQVGVCCTTDVPGPAEPATKAPVMIPPFAIPAWLKLIPACMNVNF